MYMYNVNSPKFLSYNCTFKTYKYIELWYVDGAVFNPKGERQDNIVSL